MSESGLARAAKRQEFVHEGCSVAYQVLGPSNGTTARQRRVLRTPAVRPGPGSYRLLCWLSRLGVAGVEPMRLALGLSQSVAYKHLARLADAGMVARVVAGDGEGGVVRITRAGAREARERGETAVVAPRSAAPSSARHDRAVSWVAASCEVREWEWLGPAALRQQPGWRGWRDDGARHLPDLGFVFEDQRVAIEVELHAKARKRLWAILRSYQRLIDEKGLAGVTYITDREDVAALVRREAKRTFLGKGLAVGSLDQIVSMTRQRAPRRSNG
jgi:DNA-binding transcriptional ArsR family regulator